MPSPHSPDRTRSLSAIPPPWNYQDASAQMAQSRPLDTALMGLHYIYPITVFLYYVIASSIALCTLSQKKEHRRRRLLLYLMLAAVLSYFGQIATLLVRSAMSRKMPGQQDSMISLLSCILVFGIQLAALSESEKVSWYPYVGPYLLALAFEPALEIITLAVRPSGPLIASEIAQICIFVARYLVIGLIVAVYFMQQYAKGLEDGSEAEHQPLIPNRNANATGASDANQNQENSSYSSTSTSSGYGTTAENSTAENSSSDSETVASETNATGNANESPWERRERIAREGMEKRLKENGNWFHYAKRFLIFFPYIWPVNNRRLQIRAVLVGACLLVNNALNVFIPRQLGIIMDSLSHVNDKNPWMQVIIFAGLKFCASESGISLLRQWLWVPVEFYSFDAMSTAAYSHVLNLSSDFHDSKSSSDIMMAITSGQSVSNLLESLCFSAIPMMIDMSIAFVYLSVTFGPYEGFITITTSVLFFYIAGRMISLLKNARRGEVNAWYEEHYVRQAGIQGWSTVASFNQVNHEEQRYSCAVKNRVERSQAVYFGYLIAYAFQYLVLLAGLLAGAFLAVWQVTSGKATPGQFIMLLTYWTQLVAPLTFFASLGKNMSRNLIHAEALLEIMKTKPTIINKDNALDLKFSGGAVEFDHVYFSYSDKKKGILKDITFTAHPGMTIAFVGATGAGKSTILKLLDRFYDVTEGCIKIDGQDIRDVDLFSLRSRIGIVPQAPILFDDSVMNNVRYAKLDASDEEVFEACRAASIHDQIISFTDGYNTRVGERGIKLSGGELQRIAIARAILKNPSIVLLDEATSSVDTETEQNIQEALHALCHGRTTFVVAHRLSTVMNADCIIVVSGGEIVEKGSHEELIRAGGKYESLWSKQVFVKPKDSTTYGAEGTLQGTFSDDLGLNVSKKDLANVPTVSSKQAMAETGTNKISQGTKAQDVDEGSSRTNSCDSSSHSQEGLASASESTTKHNELQESRLNPVAATFIPKAVTSGPPTVLDSSHVAVESENTSAEARPSISAFHDTPTATSYSQQQECVNGDQSELEHYGCATSNSHIHEASSSVSDHSRLGREASDELQQSTETTDSELSPQTTSNPGSGAQGSTGAPDYSNGSIKVKGKQNKIKWSRPRYSRRVQSKSEPSAANTMMTDT